jgi:hypothetical protein
MNSEDQVGWDPLGCNHEDDGNLEMRGLLQNKPIRLRPNGATSNTFTRAFKYLLVRALAILITIFIGVFITVVIANRGGQIDAIVAQEVNIKVMRNLPFQYSFYRAPTPEQQAIIDQLRAQYSAAAGLTLPFIPRHIVWTFRALKLDLGNNVKITSAPGSVYPSHRARDIILTDLPHSLLLIGTSFLHRQVVFPAGSSFICPQLGLGNHPGADLRGGLAFTPPQWNLRHDPASDLVGTLLHDYQAHDSAGSGNLLELVFPILVFLENILPDVCT